MMNQGQNISCPMDNPFYRNRIIQNLVQHHIVFVGHDPRPIPQFRKTGLRVRKTPDVKTLLTQLLQKRHSTGGGILCDEIGNRL